MRSRVAGGGVGLLVADAPTPGGTRVSALSARGSTVERPRTPTDSATVAAREPGPGRAPTGGRVRVRSGL